MSVLCACMYVYYMNVTTVQKGVLDATELEVQMVLSDCVGAVNQTWVFCRDESS